MRNNEHTFEASSVTISTYANTLNVNKFNPSSYHSKGTDVHTYSFGIKTSNDQLQNKTLFMTWQIIVAVNSYFVKFQ